MMFDVIGDEIVYDHRTVATLAPGLNATFRDEVVEMLRYGLVDTVDDEIGELRQRIRELEDAGS